MKLICCKINNYKSLSDEKNIIYLNDLTVILGKNESGKSNIIEAISNIDFIGYTENEFFKNKNRKSNKDVSIELTFRTTKTDLETSKYKNEIVVNVESADVCKIDEKFGEFILNKKSIKEQYKKVNDFLENKTLPISQPDNVKIYREIVDRLKKINTQIFIYPIGYNNFFAKLRQSGISDLIEFCDLIEDLENKLESVYCDFPQFIFISNKGMQSSYSINEYDKEIELEEKSILYQFLYLTKIDLKELREVMESKDNSYIMNKQLEYNDFIKSNFTSNFNSFYSQELVDIQIMISFNSLNFLVKTKGVFLDYSERSNGLKWYVNIFIQLLFNSRSKLSNNIILLDEPGVFLHPLAQKELTKLFNDLSTMGNQLIYSTHSPFMINYNEFYNIRAVEKDNNGFSIIYNKITEFPRESKNKSETITPLINAMGYNISLAIGPNYSNKNIIVEGITDYFYINSYIMQKKLKKEYNIISSVGADNIPAIASILYGWGCDFVIILDQDSKGRSVYDKIKDTQQPYLDKVIFADTNEYNKNIKFEIEDNFNEIDKNNLGLNLSEYKDNKYYYAMTCYELVKNNEYILNNTTIKNFDKIFKKIN